LTPTVHSAKWTVLPCILLSAVLACSVTHAEPWEVYDTPYFRMICHKDHQKQARAIGDLAEQSYDTIIRNIGTGKKARVEIVVCSTDKEFDEWTGGGLPDWGIGCALLGEGRIVLRSRSEGEDRWREIVLHELTHVALHRALGGQRTPRWFHEGVAMWQSQQWSPSRSLSTATTLLIHGLIPLEEIDHVFSYLPSKADQAYTESFLAVAYLQHVAGPNAIRRLVRNMQRGMEFGSALEITCGCSVADFQEGWAEFVRREYGWLSLASSLLSGPHLWVLCAGLFLLVYLIKRHKSRKAAREWEEEEQEGLGVHIIRFPRKRAES